MFTDASMQGDRLSLWKLPPLEAIQAGFEHARAHQPASIMLTVVMKLGTTAFKKDLLKQTQRRITGMKSEVLASFRRDLEQISTGQTDQHMTEAVVALVATWATYEGLPSTAVEQLRQDMELFRGGLTDVVFMKSLIQAVVTANFMNTNQGFTLLKRYLEHWHKQHLDRNLDKTLEAARQAKKRSSKSPSSSDDEPRYTLEELESIKLAILLRKALGDEHAAQTQLLSAIHLAELAEQYADDASRVQQINQLLHKRCTGLGNQRMIAAISDAVIRSSTTHVADVNMLKQLRDILTEYNVAFQQAQRRVRRSKHRTKYDQPDLPLIRYLIHLLARSSNTVAADDGVNWLRTHLERWYQAHPSNDIEAKLAEAGQHRSPDQLRHLRYALLLRVYLETTCAISTDVLVLAELAEMAARHLGDGPELLSSLLSRCYNETYSLFKYPLPAVLRESVFFDCAAVILGWCQLVVDYKAERDKKIPVNQPTQSPNQSPIFCWLHLFRGKRVACIVLIYCMWRAEASAYRSAAARVVPIGPDIGKTLGNPDPQRPFRRKPGQRMTGLRRSTILESASIGKRGTRRLKQWLLSYDIAITTLRSVEVLLHPTLYTDQEVQDAKSTPHPWWTGHRLRRGVKRTRPAQYGGQRQHRPLYLWRLSKYDQLKLRNQLREQITHIQEFEAIKADIERFLEPAPPTYPHVVPPLLTESEIMELPATPHNFPGESWEVRQDHYFQGLDWFYDVRPSRNKPNPQTTADTFATKLYDVETMAARNLEQVATELRSSDLHPIRFKRTMNARLEPKAFTLLFSEITMHGCKTHRYVLLCELAGVNAPERDVLKDRDHPDSSQSQYFVNFPQQRFYRPKQTPLTFFSAEIVDRYQGEILRDLIDRQRHAPVTCTNACTFKEMGKHLPDCAPEAAITTAKIVEKLGSLRHVDWYVHLPVLIPLPPYTTQPNAVIGFHEHQGNYYFAALDLTGKLIDIGEVKGPDKVGPQTTKGKRNENFAFEMAWAMVRQSQTKRYRAYMGVEDTSWKRKKISIRPEENTEKFAFPRQRIIEIATYKTAMSGMLVPVSIRYVAPMRDCGRCGHRVMDEQGVRWHAVRSCFHCQTLGLKHTLIASETVDGIQQMQCSRCKRLWAGKEPCFRCPRCRWKQYVRYNTAIVVARRTLESLITDEHVLDKGEDNILQ